MWEGCLISPRETLAADDAGKTIPPVYGGRGSTTTPLSIQSKRRRDRPRMLSSSVVCRLTHRGGNGNPQQTRPGGYGDSRFRSGVHSRAGSMSTVTPW